MLNRELVFKAWSPSEKRMSQPFDFYEWSRWNEHAQRDAIDEIRDPLFLQYIGIVDRYGNRIFEGDIVQDQFFTYTVSYSPSQAKFAIELPAHEAVILGNIFENPELASGKPAHAEKYCRGYEGEKI